MDQSAQVSSTTRRSVEVLMRRFPSHISEIAEPGGAFRLGIVVPYPTMVICTPSDLSSVPGVSRVEPVGPDTVMLVQGNPKPILAALAAADIVDLAFPEPQLEDVFLGFYNDA